MTKKQAADDERIRNCIEGKFGQAKLPRTSLTSFAFTFLLLNLSTLLSRLFCGFLWQFFKTTSFFVTYINTSFVLADGTQQKLIFSFV